MIDAKAKHPNCAYMWINWITTPDIQAQVASYFGEAPANLKACALIDHRQGSCDAVPRHRRDLLRPASGTGRRPTPKCLDGRTDVTCKDFADWIAAWDEIKG